MYAHGVKRKNCVQGKIKQKMKQGVFKIIENKEIASNMMKMLLQGDVSEIKTPGQFVNIAVPGKFLRRPISVCNVEDGTLTLIYKIVGSGTEILSKMKTGSSLDILTGLGNGYNLSDTRIGDVPLLVGGGSGIPPLYFLSKKLLESGKSVKVVLGFNQKEDIYLVEEFKQLGCEVFLSTVDGSSGTKGFVTDAIKELEENPTYYFACGPLPMLKAIQSSLKIDGQMSLEARMGCGFGACMGCSIKIKSGNKRICKEGPVFDAKEIFQW